MHRQRFARHLIHALLAACATALAAPVLTQDAAAQYKAAITNPARLDDDRKGDARRKPAEFLAFAKVRPGMKVLDVAAGGGATSALLAAAVGPSGQVWAQSAKPSPKLDARLAASPMPNLRPVVAPFDNPVPAGTPPLDLITIDMSYHDIVNTPADRAAMNKHLYDALKPGGALVIIDNAAKEGSGLTATNTLHRIDEVAVVAEVTRAGFALETKSDYLRAPGDPRDQPFFKMEGKPDDKFALHFVKR
ncbi:class I SAM-dependent methyltransferase [Massilia sp. TWR1-2-2]|uniref:class I SAM-dependent methyltransferase n=1 Tax=Massilia sp. TWR1-2-2 TaxID=2804584 RepID=UPI003CEC1253